MPERARVQDALRILVVTRSYPAPGDLYQYPFVHRRVLAYRALGHEVAVFRPNGGEQCTAEFEGVSWQSGGPADLAAVAGRWSPDVIAAHGLSEAMWPAVSQLDSIGIRAWLHGSEIPAFFRRKAELIADAVERDRALTQVEERRTFWRGLLADAPPKLKLIFPSKGAVSLAREDMGDRLGDIRYDILPNPIDTELFRYAPKPAEQRWSVLSIRPYDSPSYANDLAVAAVKRLSTRRGFDRLRFTFIGDGPLFEDTLRPVREIPNVTIRRTFLTQREIAEEHRGHGIFLVPTRLDTQGVSRDEAMASGLVPVTNDLPVVREFADEKCAALAAPDDSTGLADELWRMVEDPELFQRRSTAAAERVRWQSGNERIIPAELALLAEAADG
jgi:glycosyltransferase involved in cell wall biosynthesis